jgi:DNA polymerase III sliding clamp (beta) subunit (PCNA family)
MMCDSFPGVITDSPFKEYGVDVTPYIGTILAGELYTAISKTARCMSTDDGRKVLTGLHLRFADEAFCVASDTHRLAYLPLNYFHSLEKYHFTEVKNEETDKKSYEWSIDGRANMAVVIPKETVKFLISILRKPENQYTSVRFFDMGGHLRIEIGDMTIITRLIDGTYPNFKFAIPSPGVNTLRVTVNNLEFCMALRKLLTIGSADYGVYLRSGQDGRLQLSLEETYSDSPTLALSVDAEFVNNSTDPETSGTALAVKLNGNFLMDALKVLPQENVIFSFRPGKPYDSPVRIDGGDLQQVVIMMKMCGCEVKRTEGVSYGQ